MKQFSGAVKAIALMISMLAAVTDSSAQAGRDTLLKAAYLVHLCHFVDWPETAFSSVTAPLVITIMGPDPFGTSLDQRIQGESVNGHKLVVERVQDADELKPCHLLFISEKEEGYKEALQAVSGKGTLTVSCDRNFIRYGGMVRFEVNHNRIRLEINEDMARQEHMIISSKLLRIAKVIEPNNR